MLVQIQTLKKRAEKRIHRAFNDPKSKSLSTTDESGEEDDDVFDKDIALELDKSVKTYVDAKFKSTIDQVSKSSLNNTIHPMSLTVPLKLFTGKLNR